MATTVSIWVEASEVVLDLAKLIGFFVMIHHPMLVRPRSCRLLWTNPTHKGPPACAGNLLFRREIFNTVDFTGKTIQQ